MYDFTSINNTNTSNVLLLFDLITQMGAIQMPAKPAYQILANIQVCAKIQKMVTAALGTKPMT